MPSYRVSSSRDWAAVAFYVPDDLKRGVGFSMMAYLCLPSTTILSSKPAWAAQPAELTAGAAPHQKK